MKQTTNFNLSCKFIELNRTFHELSKTGIENDDSDISRLLGTGERLSWPGLIKEYRLIILSEDGSGKTYEIQNVARMLREQGKPAFFLRLENIPLDFEDAFEVGTFEAFEDWLISGEEGWLLLDSIDEARLRNPRDFELAIRKLSRRINNVKDWTHIIITGRTTAWRPLSDLSYCTNQFPYVAPISSESDLQAEPDPEGRLQTETKANDRDKSTFKIVSFDDLTSEQIEVFAKDRGIEDAKSFLEAVERADAWSFTSRPQDLEELTEYWIDKGRIGTRLELMQNSIDLRLVERDQDRAETYPLSAERAREGLRILSAATTLVQNQTIRVPDGAKNSEGIAVQSVLPDWDDQDQLTLLSRPIFDEAIYGTVRFHHRSVREYLTAEWFTKLLESETSRRTIEKLFFRNQYGLEIVVPTLRPILPWLVILDEKIRERVRTVAPEIIFEGGDPSQLPLEVRQYILREVCEQMEKGATGRSMHDYAAVLRFANPDLTDDVRALIRKYENNEDLVAFLLRMVWLGQLTLALPEAMKFSLMPTAEKYTRMTAFRAVIAIGADEDMEKIRQSFLMESSELKREWLAELLEGIQLTAKTLTWLLACLEKVGPKKRYSVDLLTEKVSELVGAAKIELLPQLVSGLNSLLSLPPMIEHLYCDVSEKFKWLILPACKAVERLILTHHPASLEIDSLAILHKFTTLRDYESNDLNKIKVDFSQLVPSWKELNWCLFWYEVEKSRERVAKKHGERLTDFWRVSIFGSIWRFQASDFETVAEEVNRQTFLDNKLVALSIAFRLYRETNRPRAWRMKLKKLVLGNDELSERLNSYLRPSPKSKEERRWKKQEAKWKKEAEARRRKTEKYHADWKKFLNDKFDEIRAALQNNPGTLTRPLHYLFDQTRDRRNKKRSSSRWTEYNWKTLITEYGEKIARFYRDGTVSFWRNHKPKVRSQGAPFNQTPYAVIIGLTGLEIEANEIEGWPENLSAGEVELACEYASFELNGFPTWFYRLYDMHSDIVCKFLLQEIKYELSIEQQKEDTHYIISDLSWSGQWAWDKLGSHIYDILKKEPKNLSNLDDLLKIIQGSTLSDKLIEKLSARKCRSLKKLEHVARWFAVWVGVDSHVGIASLNTKIKQITDPAKQTLFSMIFITQLLGGRISRGANVREAFKTPEHLKSLYLLMHKYIRREEDINRAGAGTYSPGLRDNAQDARSSLFNLLNQIPGKESFLALCDIAKLHPDEESRSWILLSAKKKAEQDGNMEPWPASDVREFYNKLECTPSNHRELAELAIFRILDLKDDLEHGDSSIANILKAVTLETDMRKFIGKELREKAFGRYSIPQEEELADAKRPDLRFHGVGFDQPVPIELKLADNWSGPKLFERLENQLCGDYLRDNRSNRGVFVLVYRGEKKSWEELDGVSVNFVELTMALQKYWRQISADYPNVDDIEVIGIDLSKRSS
ncbi:hypothetical protein [Desulfobacula sp.]|uniref:NACHT domain-containing protein n=1 Tax=Desulfobacula sp. TaxID=2593537 RepID=UPI002622DD64|nr:hypothetical protein [Desulfobacula sp.]